MHVKSCATESLRKTEKTKIFIPFWVALIIIFAADAIFLGITYPLPYMVQSLFGWFPTAVGFGEDYPIDTNATAAGRRNNRRVEINLNKN